MAANDSRRDDAPLCLLVAALGGEGGGVLADWIVDCALAQGLPVQATSVPGVAQRTGATSYYIEMMRVPAPAGAAPVFSLNPMPGAVDVVVASELLEAGRMIERGFVSPARTTLIAARHRIYTTLEKMQMGDGRFDDGRVHEAARRFAKRYLSLDMAALASRHGTVISAVMFGALAGAHVFPWPREACVAAIRRGGVGVETSLAGFDAAFSVAAGDSIEALLTDGPGLRRPIPEDWLPLVVALPDAVHVTAAHGVARLVDWQDEAWAREYVHSLRKLSALARAAEAQPVLAEAARQLALWMSYEDVIRVADLKTRPERFARIRSEAQAREDEIVRVVDYLKPGYEEVAAILPRAMGQRLRDWAARGARSSPVKRGLHVSPTNVGGYLAMRGLALLRPLRRRSLRFHEERQAIERWLHALGQALQRTPELAAQVAALPRLLKGYGETWQRGLASYERIFESLVLPALRDEPGREVEAAGRIRDAIAAALADPEGRRLEQSLAGAGIEPRPPRPKPIVWMRKPRGRPLAPQIGDDVAPQISENPGTPS